MAPYWQIISLDGEEIWAWKTTQDTLSSRHLFWNDQLMGKVAEAITAPEWTNIQEIEPDNVSHAGRRPSSGLLSLPTELLHAIFYEVADLTDVLNLFAAHERLMLVGVYHVRRKVDRLISPWRGHRLMCHSGTIKDTELPSSIAQDAERMITRAKHFGSIAMNDRTEDYDSEDVDGEYFFVEEVAASFSYRHGGMTLEQVLESVFEGILAEPGAHVARFFKLYEWLVAGRPTVALPPGRLVLRNRTKREYVRGEILIPLRELCQRARAQSESPEWTGVDVALGQALLAKIFWAPNDTARKPEVLNKWAWDTVVEGPWAGDSVDIVSMERAELGDGWTDCSEDVFFLLEELLEAAFKGLLPNSV